MQIINHSAEQKIAVEKAAEVALARFKAELAFDKSQYRAEVSENEGVIVVTFLDAAVPLSIKGRSRGNPSRIPAFEVTLERGNLGVLSSNFMR